MSWLKELPLIAILRGITPNEVVEHATVLIDAGFKAIEVPTNSPQWEESISLLSQHFGDKALIGAGTVLTPDIALRVKQCGGNLIVTPNVDIETITISVEAKMLVCCGCLTPSEAFIALKAGAHVLKIFPAGCIGPGYIKAVKTVLPSNIPVFAVGGITPDNMHDYLSAGVDGAGLGSDLYKPNQTVDHTFNKAMAFVQSYQSFFADRV